MSATRGDTGHAGHAAPSVPPAAPGPGAPPRRPRRRGYVLAAGVIVVAVGGGTAWYALHDTPAPARTTGATKVATAAVTRGDVVDTESVDGTLTYADQRSIAAASGVVTWAPSEGATIRRGHSLLRVDDRPVTLMYGSMPLYRTLRNGVPDGHDVEQLEANLAALGYGADMTVDEDFTAATTAAVKAWQEDRGLPETGAVDARQVVFASGAVRVTAVKAEKGDRLRPGAPALTVTGTSRVVHVKLDAAKQDLVKKGDKVTVELPDGHTVKGRISDVGSVAASGHGDASATVDVYVRLSGGGRGTDRLDRAPVSVDLASERAKDVLSVPVEALLALREGGYGVEVVAGGGHRIVAVRTGTYGGGRVEVSGKGLRAGTKVEVPSS